MLRKGTGGRRSAAAEEIEGAAFIPTRFAGRACASGAGDRRVAGGAGSRAGRAGRDRRAAGVPPGEGPVFAGLLLERVRLERVADGPVGLADCDDRGGVEAIVEAGRHWLHRERRADSRGESVFFASRVHGRPRARSTSGGARCHQILQTIGERDRGTTVRRHPAAATSYPRDAQDCGHDDPSHLRPMTHRGHLPRQTWCHRERRRLTRRRPALPGSECRTLEDQPRPAVMVVNRTRAAVDCSITCWFTPSARTTQMKQSPAV